MVIQRSILNALKISKAGLPHPHLVFELCKATRVQWIEGEELLHHKGEINNKIVDVHKNYAEGATSSTVASDVRLSTPAKPHTPTQWMSDLETQLKYVLEYQQHTVRYQGEIVAALVGALTQCATHLQITEPLPTLPIFNPPPLGPQV